MEPITAIAVSGDGDHLVVGSTGRDLAVYKIQDGTFVKERSNGGNFTDTINSIFSAKITSISCIDDYIYTASDDKITRMWDFATLTISESIPRKFIS